MGTPSALWSSPSDLVGVETICLSRANDLTPQVYLQGGLQSLQVV